MSAFSSTRPPHPSFHDTFSLNGEGMKNPAIEEKELEITSHSPPLLPPPFLKWGNTDMVSYLPLCERGIEGDFKNNQMLP